VIAAVHALVGATVGRWIGAPATAFAAGMLTHAMGDVLPHRDLKITAEAPLLLAALGLIAWRYGVRSPELAGATGAVLPDVENAAWMTGLMPRDRVIFPTHRDEGRYHGPEAQSAWPQAPIALACLAFLLSQPGRARR
jgi:hypothetical protein